MKPIYSVKEIYCAYITHAIIELKRARQIAEKAEQWEISKVIKLLNTIKDEGAKSLDESKKSNESESLDEFEPMS